MNIPQIPCQELVTPRSQLRSREPSTQKQPAGKLSMFSTLMFMYERQVVPAPQKKWCDNRGYKKRTPGPRQRSFRHWLQKWLCQTWLFCALLRTVGLQETWRSLQKQRIMDHDWAQDHAPSQSTQMLASIQKDILNTLLKSGSLMLWWEKFLSLVDTHTHQPLPTASELQGSPGGQSFCTHTATIYSCLPPAYTPSDARPSLAAAVAR